MNFFKLLILISILLYSNTIRAQIVVDSSRLNTTLEDQQLLAPPPAPDSTNNTLKINNEPIVLDTTVSQKIDTPNIYQIKVGIDVFRLAQNFYLNQSNGYQFAADYLFRKNYYGVIEAGIGKGLVAYEHLQYTTNSYNIKLGIDKPMLERIAFSDLDHFFFGFRYGLAFGNISDANYSISSILGSPTEGIIPERNYVAHWGEMNAGIRVEMIKNWVMGWNFRAKFLLNSSTFNEGVKPIYISGYGSADKATVFDFSIFLLYSIKWVK